MTTPVVALLMPIYNYDSFGFESRGAIGQMIATSESLGIYSIDNLGMSTAVAQKLEAVSRDLFAKTGYARWFDFLINPKTGIDYGEDTSFCVKAKACGFQVHADSTIDVGHVGQFTFGLQHYFQKRGVAQ